MGFSECTRIDDHGVRKGFAITHFAVKMFFNSFPTASLGHIIEDSCDNRYRHNGSNQLDRKTPRGRHSHPWVRWLHGRRSNKINSSEAVEEPRFTWGQRFGHSTKNTRSTRFTNMFHLMMPAVINKFSIPALTNGENLLR